MPNTIPQELEMHTINPPGGDERIACFSQAVLDISKTKVGADMLATVESRHFETASYGANLLLRAVQKQLLRSDPGYPYEYDDHHKWRVALDHLLVEPKQMTEIVSDLEHKSTQSNVVSRYKAFKLVIELLSPLVPDQPQIADIGCSRNHGLKKLHLGLPFKPIECGIRATDSRLSSTLTDKLCNVAIAAPRTLGESAGT